MEGCAQRIFTWPTISMYRKAETLFIHWLRVQVEEHHALFPLINFGWECDLFIAAGARSIASRQTLLLYYQKAGQMHCGVDNFSSQTSARRPAVGVRGNTVSKAQRDAARLPITGPSVRVTYRTRSRLSFPVRLLRVPKDKLSRTGWRGQIVALLL